MVHQTSGKTARNFYWKRMYVNTTISFLGLKFKNFAGRGAGWRVEISECMLGSNLMSEQCEGWISGQSWSVSESPEELLKMLISPLKDG
jgi:hypothetical protein